MKLETASGLELQTVLKQLETSFGKHDSRQIYKISIVSQNNSWISPTIRFSRIEGQISDLGQRSSEGQKRQKSHPDDFDRRQHISSPGTKSWSNCNTFLSTKSIEASKIFLPRTPVWLYKLPEHPTKNLNKSVTTMITPVTLDVAQRHYKGSLIKLSCRAKIAC